MTFVVIGSGVARIGYEAFYYCEKLRTVVNNSNLNITKGSTDNGYVAYYVNRVRSCEILNGFCFDKAVLVGYFGGESNLTLPESYEGQGYEIGDDAFYGHKKITSITIPNNVTSIGSYALAGTSITSIDIPTSVKSIGSNAFAETPLRTIVSRNASPRYSETPFSNYTYIHAPLYVPEGAYWNYAYATGWGDFIHIKEMATEASSLQSRKAYMIADDMGCNYQVYDAQKDAMKTVEYTHSLDEESEDCCWTVITENGKTYLYNLGAKKFGVVNDEGALTLSKTPVNVTISENENGLSINGANCMFVLNKNVEVEITGINDVLINGADTKNAQIHSLDGRRQKHVTRGINIVNGKKVLVK